MCIRDSPRKVPHQGVHSEGRMSATGAGRRRCRWAAAAEVRGITVRALLDQLSCQVEDAALMEQAARQMRQLREVDPEAWGNYLTEGGQWEEATIERLDA